MRKRIGDWFRLLQLMRAGPSVKKLPLLDYSTQALENEMQRSTMNAASDPQLEEAFTEMGNNFLERRNYETAVKYFKWGRNLAKQAECVYFLEDYETLSQILEQIPDNNELLPVRSHYYLF
jgi:hypothetical protein